MKTFQIWMEGYIATGESGRAQMIGTGKGETFNDAVKDFMKENPTDHRIQENTRKRYTTQEAYDTRDSNWNIWACDLYDNHADAAKAFG